MVFDVKPFHIVDLLDRVKEKSEVACAKKGLGISYGVDASVSTAVKGDRARLEHVLSTLVHTSVDHSRPGGGIHVSVEMGTKKKGQLTFAVRGHGAGIPKVRVGPPGKRCVGGRPGTPTLPPPTSPLSPVLSPSLPRRSTRFCSGTWRRSRQRNWRWGRVRAWPWRSAQTS